jgi:PAS domain S-box-containing protein
MNVRDVRGEARVRVGTTLHAFLTRLIWLCMGPLVLLAAYLAIDRVRRVQDERTLETTNLAKTLATAVDQDLSARIGALKVLAESPLLEDASRWKEFYMEAQGFHQSFGSHVILADLQMHMLLNTRMSFGTALPMLPRPKGRAAAPIAAETGRPAVGDSFQGPLANEPLVAVAVPVVRQGKTVLLLLTVFEARQFQTHLEQIALPAGWSLALVDGNGEAIARRAPRDFKPAAEVDASGRVIMKSALSAWSVMLEVPRDMYRAPLQEAAAALALAVLGATVVGVVGGTLASRRLARAVSSLVETPMPGADPPEITEIASVRHLLDEASQRREAAEATLLVSEQRFRRLFYEAPLPQALIAKNGVLVGLNARFVQVFGYGLEDVPTLAEWWARAHPDPAYRRSVIDAWNAAMARVGVTAANIEPVERRISCKNGEVRVMVVSGIGIGDDFLSTFFDVTERKRVQEVRQRLAAIVESSDDAIVSSTIDGAITSWNHGAERTFGYSAREAVGKRVREIIRPEDGEATRVPERRIFHARQGAGHAGAEEMVRLHKDGHPITLSVVTGVIRDASGAPSELAAIMRDITLAQRRDAELQRLVADQQARERLMRDLTARLRTLREEECSRISREVHDGLGQLLTCLKMDIRWMSRRLATGTAAEDLSAKLAETEALVDQTVESVQRIAVELRPSVLDALGLPAAIRDEARRFEARTGVATVVETSTSSPPGPAVATALFRILQELLTNTARHACASSLSVTLVDERDAWILRVCDDGVGIPVDVANRATSLGLLGMIERAEAIGGTCRVERAQDGGTLATVRVPYPAPSESRHAVRSDC